MKDKTIVRLHFFAAAILVLVSLTVYRGDGWSMFAGLLVMGLPALIIGTWLSGFATSLIKKWHYLLGFLLGAFIGVFALGFGNASWFIIPSFTNSDALNGALMVAAFSIFYAGIPAAILGGLAAVSSKLVMTKRAEAESLPDTND